MTACPCAGVPTLTCPQCGAPGLAGTSARIDAMMARHRIARREYVRADYARAVAYWRQTREYEAGTGGIMRGLKMSATYDLKRAGRALDALLNEEA